MVLTLIEKNIAAVGYKFTHLGGMKVCENCNLNKVCVDSLESNISYVVTEVRNIEHLCLIDNQVMLVCNVEETSNIISVENQKFLENIVVKRAPIHCDEILCKNYEYCIHPNYQKESKIKVLELKGKIHCPLNLELVLAEVKKITDK